MTRFIYMTMFVVGFQQSVVCQDLRYNLYQFDLKSISPALTGLEESQSLSALFKFSTVSQNSPSAILLGYETRLSGINSGLGLMFENKSLGIQTTVKINSLYNYQHELKHNKKLSFGLGLNYLSETHDYDQLNIVDDQSFRTREKPYKNFDLDLSLAYISNIIYGSITIKNLTESKITDESMFNSRKTNAQTASAIIGLNLKVNEWLALQPSFLFITDYENRKADFNLTTKWLDLILVGLTYRVDKIQNQAFANQNKNFRVLHAGVEVSDKIRLVGMLSSNRYLGDENFEFSLVAKITNK